MRRRLIIAAVGGVAGPAVFTAAWSILPLWRPGYSPVNEPISRLAAVDSPTRAVMTAGFLAFGLGVGVYATGLRVALPGPSGIAAATTAAATVGIAATPLGSALGGSAHAVCAGVAYAALAAVPVLGGRSLARQGRRRTAAVSFAVGVASGLTLLASAVAPRWPGFLQRVGLTLGDGWIVATAVWMAVRGRPEPAAEAGESAPARCS